MVNQTKKFVLLVKRAVPAGLLLVSLSAKVSAEIGLDWVEEPGYRVTKPSNLYYISEPSVLALPSGQYRMYYQESPSSSSAYIVSALSNDGLVWQKENGTRLSSAGAPCVIQLEDDSYRMYFHYWAYDYEFSRSIYIVYSAVSSDGLVWTRVPNFKIKQATYPEVVPLGSGMYRMYYQKFSTVAEGIRSAVSYDHGSSWQLEEGVRIGIDQGGYTNGVLRLQDGRVRMYFSGNGAPGIRSAISSDGLNWVLEEGFRVEGAYQPEVVELPDGSLRMYYLKDYDHILSALSVEQDTDGDGVLDGDDNCPESLNPDQEDFDSDGLGDVCDADDDNDSVLDGSDNCQFAANPQQEDNDQDLIGDDCDEDDDNDHIIDIEDNCPFSTNQDQSDMDADGLGDVCDADLDGDGVVVNDNCPFTPNFLQEDSDTDGQGDACDDDDDNDGLLDAVDNCPSVANSGQEDLDADHIGDACDSDIDGDGIENEVDNCELVPNVGQDDTDFDGQGDSCDDDDDEDLILDSEDNCPLIPNPSQLDFDLDGIGDVCDEDLDGDGFANSMDNCPTVANSNQSDWDADAFGDVCDEDVDGDGVANESDMCAFTDLEVVVDQDTGCSVDQLCPCQGPRGTSGAWKNHGKYVACVAKSLEDLMEKGLITEAEKEVLVSASARSQCGGK